MRVGFWRDRGEQSPAGLAVRGLVALTVAIAAVQFLSSHLGTQSSWKGGGFGMYTDPHPQNRIVWLVLETAEGPYPVALWPVTERFEADHAGIGKSERRSLKRAVDLAYNLATSGDRAVSAEIAEIATKLEWGVAPDRMPAVSAPDRVTVTGARVEMYELRFDIANRRIATRELYGHGD